MDVDVAIVGSGPAGASAAYYLRDSGLSVVVIERLSLERYPRYHSICGSAVSTRGVKHLDLQENEILDNIDTLKIRFPGDRILHLRSKGYVISRPALLNRLHDAALDKGVSFIQSSVQKVESTENGYVLTMFNGSSVFARYVIGADGCYSVVRKDIFGSRPDIILKVEEWHASGKAQDNVLEFIMSDHASQLYTWVFPYGDQICLGPMPEESVPEGSVRGARSIPLGHVGKIVDKNCLLVGDAAGLPNPMTAGGLSAAFLSSYHAAQAIIKGHPLDYQNWWDHYRGSDSRFLKVHNTISSFSDEELVRFADHFTHKGLWLNGFISFLHHPKYLWLYFGCLMSLRYGW